jgi:hypothetical protein
MQSPGRRVRGAIDDDGVDVEPESQWQHRLDRTYRRQQSVLTRGAGGVPFTAWRLQLVPGHCRANGG